MNVLWVFAVVTGSTGLVDRPITAGQGNACSSGEDQIKHVGVMIEALTCVERVPNIAVYRENNLVCEAVDYVKVLPFTDRLAFFSCVAKETGDLLGGSGGVQVALDTVCDAGASADTFISQGTIRDCLIVPLDPDFAHDATGHFCQPLVDAWDCIQQAHIQSPCYKADTATAAMLQSYSGLCPITFPSYTLTIDMWATSSIAVDQLPSELGGYKYKQQAYLCQQISSKINSVDLCSGLWAISKDGIFTAVVEHYMSAAQRARPFEPPTLRAGAGGQSLQAFELQILYTKKGTPAEIVHPVQIYADNIMLSIDGAIYALQQDPALGILYPSNSDQSRDDAGSTLPELGFEDSAMSEGDLLLERSIKCVDLLTPERMPWTDVDNDGCAFYAAGSASACTEWGADFAFAANDLTAKTACCGCGGGRMEFRLGAEYDTAEDDDFNGDDDDSNFLKYNEYANGTCTEALIAKGKMCPVDSVCVDTRSGDGHYCRPDSINGRVSIAAADLSASMAALLSSPNGEPDAVVLDTSQASGGKPTIKPTTKVLIVVGSVLSALALVTGVVVVRKTRQMRGVARLSSGSPVGSWKSKSTANDNVQMRHPGGKPSVQWHGNGGGNRMSQFNDSHAAAAFSIDQPEWDTFNDLTDIGPGVLADSRRSLDASRASPASRQLPPRPDSRAMMVSPMSPQGGSRRTMVSPMSPQGGRSWQERRGTPPFMPDIEHMMGSSGDRNNNANANSRPMIRNVNFADTKLDNMRDPDVDANPMDRMMDAYMTLNPHADEAVLEASQSAHGSPARPEDFIARSSSFQTPEVKRLSRDMATPHQQHYQNEQQMRAGAREQSINDAADAALNVIHGGGPRRVSRAQLRGEWREQKKASQISLPFTSRRGDRGGLVPSQPMQQQHRLPKAASPYASLDANDDDDVGGTGHNGMSMSVALSKLSKRLGTADSAEYAIADRPDEEPAHGGDASFSQFVPEGEGLYENAPGSSDYHLAGRRSGRQISDSGTILADHDMADQIYNVAAAGDIGGSGINSRAVTKRRPASYYAAQGRYGPDGDNGVEAEGDYHLASTGLGAGGRGNMMHSHISEGDYDLAAAGNAGRRGTDNTDASGVDDDDVYDFATVPTNL